VPFYAISLLLMAASLALVFTKGLNLGVDFVGGQSIRVDFAEQTAPVAQVREEIDALGYGEPIIQQVGDPNQIVDPHEAARRERRALSDRWSATSARRSSATIPGARSAPRARSRARSPTSCSAAA
jgi:preprotein translocase subunit SecF